MYRALQESFFYYVGVAECRAVWPNSFSPSNDAADSDLLMGGKSRIWEADRTASRGKETAICSPAGESVTSANKRQMMNTRFALPGPAGRGQILLPDRIMQTDSERASETSGVGNQLEGSGGPHGCQRCRRSPLPQRG